MQELFGVKYSWLIPLLPLIGAGVSGLFGARCLKQRSHWPIWIGVGLSAVISFFLLFAMFGQWEKGEASTSTQQEPLAHSTLSATSVWYVWGQAGDPHNENIEPGQRPSFFRALAGAFIDPLTATMLCVVTGIGFFIIVFSKGYMAGEAGYFRFFAYLGLFIFAMTILVMGENLVMLYLGWEGVGLCSYLLIGYYYEKPSAREAAKKAFIVNRIGDFGFGIGIMLCFLIFGTVSYYGGDPTQAKGVLTRAASPDFLAHLAPWQQKCVWWIPFCLMLGAFGKSAQFPLYVWLPDAMEGPTPVSALIHAATMVTAGVYMIVRCSTLFYQNNAAILTVAAVGCFTAILAATIALRQFDLKKVFAYSTISQLGFMFVGVGVLAPVAGIFHLVTHAFFKALLFLSSGVVMHAMAGELDMRKMSGLKRVLPITRVCILIGCLALAGFPFFSGFFSKDDIVAAAWGRVPVIGAILLLTAFMTAYYTFRLYFRVFEGPLVVPEAPAPAHAHGHEPHEDAAASESAMATGTGPASGVDVGAAHHAHAHGAPDHSHGAGHHNHEPLVMMIPLIVLAIGAFAAGWLNFPERAGSLGGFLAQSPSLTLGYQVAQAHLGYTQGESFGMESAGAHTAWVSLIVGGLISIAGILVAWYLHLANRGMAEQLARAMGGVVTLVENKFYVDEIYQACVVEALRTFGRILYFFDRFIDGLVNFTGWLPQIPGYSLKLTVQRGYLQGYATAMLFGIMIILVIIFL